MDAAAEIKARLSMMDVAERFGQVSDRSGYIKCPFHTEQTPSLKIYKEPGRGFCCFGCGAKGSVIDFVMRLLGISFRQAVLRLGSDFGIIINNSPAGIKEARRVRAEQTAKARAKKALDMNLQSLAEEHCAAWWTVKETEPWTDAWCLAVERIPMINLEMEGLCTQEKTI